MIRVAPLDEGLAPRWAALFEAAACPCFCRYWHFEGDKNAWLDRCAQRPDENRREQLALVATGDARAGGLVALEGDDAVGWMKLVPRGVLPKLKRQSVYRALDLGDDEGVLSVGCFLVHPAHRKRGVARALLAAAIPHARGLGARAIEAYPRHTSEPVSDEEVWLGPEALLLELGFEPIAGEQPYRVLRKVL
jgi:GNAT superfamily N-acetyltransferase